MLPEYTRSRFFRVLKFMTERWHEVVYCRLDPWCALLMLEHVFPDPRWRGQWYDSSPRRRSRRKKHREKVVVLWDIEENIKKSLQNLLWFGYKSSSVFIAMAYCLDEDLRRR